MKKVLKWAGLLVLGLLVLALAAAFYLSSSFAGRLNQVYDVQPAAVFVSSDSASIARGKHLADVHCRGCHGSDLGGTAFFVDSSLGSIPAPNLTAGRGGKGSAYTEVDFVRAIRHGVKHDGKPAFIMPAGDFSHLSDEDLGALVAYLRTVPPVDKPWPTPRLTFLARTLAGAGAFGDVLNAETIDHDALKNVKAPAKGPTVAYGNYLVNLSGCRSCHGAQLNGNQSGEPGAPFAPNITPGGACGAWSNAQFMQTIRTGTTPDKRKLDPKFMPWQAFKNMTDEELTAVYRLLQSQPKLADTKH
jgi:mono/diheme cytochrome c family protein